MRMKAASKFVFAYNRSDSEDSDEEVTVVEKDKNVKRKKRRRALDTNVLKIDFQCLEEVKFVTSFEPIRCIECPAILTRNETLLNNLDGAGRKWQCSYCGSKNTLSGEQDAAQLTDDTTYISESDLENQILESNKKNSEIDEEDESIIQFCIDVSGSMGQTVITRMENGKKVYISRLDATKAAIISQLRDLTRYKPNVKVGITTFSSNVEYKGDGNSKVEIMKKSGILNDKEHILKIGTGLPPPLTIKSNLSTIIKIVNQCEPLSMTALGPALLLSTAATCKCRGSKIILCTDGMANVGLGNLEKYKNQTDVEKAEEFYGFVSNYAKEIGSSISVLAISGGECRLVELGNVAVNTNGQVNIVNPVDLGDEFKGILQENIVGTNVQATVVLPKGFYIRDYMALDNKSMFHKTFEIGTATSSTEFTLEYGLNTTSNTKITHEGSVRFQLIVNYINKRDSKIIRVIEKEMRITCNRKEAEQSMNMEVLTVNAMQQGSRLHDVGNVKSSKSKMRATKGFFEQNLKHDELFLNAQTKVTHYLEDLETERDSASNSELRIGRSDVIARNLQTNKKFSSKML